MSDAHAYEIPVEPAGREALTARLWAAGAIGVWDRDDALIAYYPAPTDAVPPGGTWRREPDRDWQAEWKATIDTVRAGRFAVVPTWRLAEHRPADGEHTIVLDPGRAFGSGHHATTLQCLELLDETALAGVRLADVGCGSGILAIAGAMLGARVQAVDLDPAAVAATRENAGRNGVEVDARVGSTAEVDGPVEVVVANLLTDTVASLAGELAALTGTLCIVSGVTAERRDVALAPLRAAGLELRELRERDGWIAAALAPR